MKQAYSVLDELIIGGEFSESSLKRVQKALKEIKDTEGEEEMLESLGATVL
ncbi:hypothetical protein HDV06_000367 [Boothiomyces sp. JEL0866]|nr:hypothetical protein HDV01_005483 [Terramyces sp. JEL0728]KAJ3324328.1 hypothetical protein HDV06_000367 [Boothiomyces sp. JEL0866]